MTQHWAKSGDRFLIRNRNWEGQPINEGVARLVTPDRLECLDPDEDRWLVDFGDGCHVRRVILRADKITD